MILTLRRLGLPPAEAGRLAERCFAGGGDDPALTATLAQQHRRIAQQREELERLELELVDLERTMAVADPARRRPPLRADQRPLRLQRQLGAQPDRPRRSSGTSAARTSRRGRRAPSRSPSIRWPSRSSRRSASTGAAARAKPVTELLDRRFDYVITLSNSRPRGVPDAARPARRAALAPRGPGLGRGDRGGPPPGIPRDPDRAVRPAAPIHRDRATRRGTPSRDHRTRARRGDQMMELPYLEPLTARPLAERVIPEPPRRGEPGGEPCGICDGRRHRAPSGATSTSRSTRRSGQPARRGLAREPRARRLVQGPLARGGGGLRPDDRGRIERAILGLGDVGRVHLYRWGDGGAHFHVWLMPAPARHAPGAGRDAADLGGRPAQRHRRGAGGRGSPDRRRAVTHAGPGPAARHR